MATVNLGRIKPVFRGAYSGSTAYVVDDIVTSGGSSYICIQAHGAGTQAVTQTAYWSVLASTGTDVSTTLTTSGDILYRDGSGLQRLAKGTASQTLQMDGSAAFPTWATVTTPSADWVKILQTNVSSAVSSVDFVHGTGGVVIDSTYRTYKLIYTWQPATAGQEPRIRVANAGTFRTSGYLTEAHRSYYSGGTSRSNGTDSILKCVGGTQADNEQRSCYEATFYNMSDAGLNTTAHQIYATIDGSGNTENQINQGTSGGVYATAEAHNGIQIVADGGGNISGGEFTLIGIKG